MSRESVDLTAAVHPVFFGEFAHFFRELDEAFRDAGLRIRPVNKTMAEYLQHSDAGDVDLDVGRWTADYPDSDTFFFGALHSASGAFRNIVGNAGDRPPLRAGPRRDRSARPPLRCTGRPKSSSRATR